MSAGASRLELPGAGLLLGLALLACLGGTLLLLAHFLAPGVAGARLLGLRFLLPGAALCVLAVAHITLQGLLQKKDALAAAVTDVAALVLLTGVLACALARDLADIPASSPPHDARAARETALAVALTWLALAVAGGEGWRAAGTYLGPSVARVASAGLFGFAAVVPTRLPGTRRLLLLAGLVGAALRTV